MKFCPECPHPFPYSDNDTKCPNCGGKLQLVPVKEKEKKGKKKKDKEEDS